MNLNKATKSLWSNLAKQNNLPIEKDGAYPVTIDLAPGSKAIISLGFNTHYDDFYITSLSVTILHEFMLEPTKHIYNMVKFPAWNETHMSGHVATGQWLKKEYPESNKYIIKDQDELNSFFVSLTNYINETLPLVYYQTNSWEKIYDELFKRRNDTITDKWNSLRDQLFIKIGIAIALNNPGKLDDLKQTMIQRYVASRSPDFLPKAEALIALLKDEKVINDLENLLVALPQNQELQFKRLVFNPQFTQSDFRIKKLPFDHHSIHAILILQSQDDLRSMFMMENDESYLLPELTEKQNDIYFGEKDGCSFLVLPYDDGNLIEAGKLTIESDILQSLMNSNTIKKALFISIFDEQNIISYVIENNLKQSSMLFINTYGFEKDGKFSEEEIQFIDSQESGFNKVEAYISCHLKSITGEEWLFSENFEALTMRKVTLKN